MQVGGFYFHRRFQDKFPALFHHHLFKGSMPQRLKVMQVPASYLHYIILGIPVIAFVIQEKVNEVLIIL